LLLYQAFFRKSLLTNPKNRDILENIKQKTGVKECTTFLAKTLKSMTLTAYRRNFVVPKQESCKSEPIE
jgi:hypothetical protein